MSRVAELFVNCVGSNGPLGDVVAEADHTIERVADRLLNRLVSHGILTRRDDRPLWVLGARRYPNVDGRPLREVKRRVMDVLLAPLHRSRERARMLRRQPEFGERYADR